jgi:hypothetical protein
MSNLAFAFLGSIASRYLSVRFGVAVPHHLNAQAQHWPQPGRHAAAYLRSKGWVGPFWYWQISERALVKSVPELMFVLPGSLAKIVNDRAHQALWRFKPLPDRKSLSAIFFRQSACHLVLPFFKRCKAMLSRLTHKRRGGA